MSATLHGFGVIGLVTLVGFVLAHLRVLGEDAQESLGRLAYAVALPALLYTNLAQADIGIFTSSAVFVSAGTTVGVGITCWVLGGFRHWDKDARLMATLCSGFANFNLGIPVATYLLGGPALVAPLIVFQMVVIIPGALGALELRRHTGGFRWFTPLVAAVRNPILIGSAVGIGASVIGPPSQDGVVSETLEMLGSMAVPLMLVTFGISMRLSPRPGLRGDSQPIAAGVALKSVVQPFLAWVIAGPLLGLDSPTVYAAVLLSSLPVAQTAYVFATQFSAAAHVVRETVLYTTLLAPLTLLTATVLLT